MACISNMEKDIVKLLFHPRIITALKSYRKRSNTSSNRVEFASARRNNPDTCPRLCEWMHQDNLHTVATNWGIMDDTQTRVLALDVVLARPRKNVTDGAELIMCTCVMDATASKNEIQTAHDHMCKIHETLHNFYHVQCSSVLLLWSSEHKFSEVWL
jgi:hypothetical protein